MVVVLLVALGAAIGAPLRYLASAKFDRAWPLGTLAVNVAGSFVLGLCVAWSLNENALAFIGVGFCGGLTTYSGFAVQTADRLMDHHSRRLGAAYAVITVVVSIAACALGYSLA
jgi:fluoride exporter